MKKPSRKKLTRLLDVAFAKYIKNRGVCQMCGKTSPLNCAHVYSRARRSVRWDKDNAFCLCVGCHMNFAHKNPIEYATWVQGMLGDERFAALILKANMQHKWSIEEMREHLRELEEMR